MMRNLESSMSWEKFAIFRKQFRSRPRQNTLSILTRVSNRVLRQKYHRPLDLRSSPISKREIHSNSSRCNRHVSFLFFTKMTKKKKKKTRSPDGYRETITSWDTEQDSKCERNRETERAQKDCECLGIFP